VSSPLTTERNIERSFPIVQLNALSVRERNAFKPVYTMHKWFARRSSSIFRAILLGAALPAEEDGKPLDLMAEFYKGHGEDARLKRPDGSPMRVLDPFMGGGTTVVEALRLGFEATGVDYNPIAWFIVRGETTPVDLDALDAAYKRVAEKVRDELLALYKTRCPLTGKDADIIYGFWVKQGICVDPSCKGVTDLFKNYEVARKRGDASLRYFPDIECPSCEKKFDWEVDRCTITAGGPQVTGASAAGKGRPEKTRWAFGRTVDGTKCPHCEKKVKWTFGNKIRPKSKTVPLHVLIDPSSGDFFDVRGEIPKKVTAPKSGHKFDPDAQDLVEAAKVHGGPLPFRFYGFYAHTPHYPEKSEDAERLGLPTNNYKWFGAASQADLTTISEAAAELARLRTSLPLPAQEIYDGYNTNRLVIHQYRRWAELYSPRQLLALGKLMKAIAEEQDASLRDALLGAFQSTLNYQSLLCRYNIQRNQIEGVTAAHDYRNPTTAAENPPLGANAGIGRGTFVNYFESLKDGLRYLNSPDLLSPDLESQSVDDLPGNAWRPRLFQGSSTDLHFTPAKTIDLVITDPPYAGSVQYAEMSDWSYVWLHQILKNHYPDEFGTEITLKSQEIIEDGATKDPAFFFENLTLAWGECHRVLVDDGLLVFTFHHKEGDRWTGLLRSIFDAGFYLVAAYPTHSEALNSIVIQATKGITYDIIHVCRKRLGETEPISWSKLRREVTREARDQLREIEQGKQVLPGPDIQMILLGKALMLFSRHYGKVLEADGNPLDLDEAMNRILKLVREIRGEELPLPGSLQDVDSLTQLALLHVVGRGPWTRDDLHKELRGYTHGPDALLAAGLVRPVSGKKGHLEAVPAVERGGSTRASAQSDGPLIDKLHLLLAQVQAGQPVLPLLKRWRGQWPVIVEALAWLGKADANVRDLVGLTIRQVEALGPDAAPKPADQLRLFGEKP